MSEATPQEPEFEPDRFVRIGVLFYGAMAVVAVLWRVGLYNESIWLTQGAEARPEDAVGTLGQFALGLGVAALVILASYAATEGTGWGQRLAKAMAEPLRGLSVPDGLLLASASGLAEELFFRGALQPRAGLVVASLLFGVLHLVPRRELLPWTAFSVVMGFVLGLLFEWTGSLLAPVVAHTAINAVNLPLLVRRYGGDEPPST